MSTRSTRNSTSSISLDHRSYDNPAMDNETLTAVPSETNIYGASDLEAQAAIGVPFDPREYNEKVKIGHKYGPGLKHFKPFRRNRNPNVFPINKSGLFSYITLSWLSSLMRKSFKIRNERGLEIDDLWTMSKEEGAANSVERLERLWNEEVEAKGVEKASMMRVWYRFVITRVAIGIVMFVFTFVFRFVYGVVLLRELLEYLEDDEPDLSWGLILSASMILLELGRMLVFACLWSVLYQTAGRLRGAFIVLIYKKLLQIRSLKKKTVGELINISINDSQRIFEATGYLVCIACIPSILSPSLVYGYWLVGPMSLIGILIFLSLCPLQYLATRLTTYFRRKSIILTDKRIRRMTEIISSIKLIKMFAWEDPFTRLIADLRFNEKRQLEKLNYVQSVSTTISPTVPMLAGVATLLSMTLGGFPLSGPEALTLISIFNQLKVGILIIPISIRYFSESKVGLSRLRDILLMEEMASETASIDDNTSTAVSFIGATYGWDKVDQDDQSIANKKDEDRIKSSSNSDVNGIRFTKSKNHVEFDLNQNDAEDFVTTLNNIQITIRKGQLVGIVGAVGAGKTSLFSAIIGQMKLMEGNCQINGKIVYAAQLPWIYNASVRENILFGSDFDEDRYWLVVHACCLEQDFEQLADGDATEVGERGINISGGQKQRISLARAVYSDRDIYLLDDPLSAVDVKVGRHIFDNCIKQALSGKTVLLATHQLQYLKDCDHVVMLRDGRVIEQGMHEALLSDGGEYADLMKTWNSVDRSTADDVTKETKVKTAKVKNGVKSAGTEKITKLVEKELNVPGDIPFKEYKKFFKAAGGYCNILLLVVLFTIYIGSSIFGNWWLSYWINQGDGSPTNNVTMSPTLARIARDSVNMTTPAFTTSATDVSSLVSIATPTETFTTVQDDITAQTGTYTLTEDFFTTVPDDRTPQEGTTTSTKNVFTTIPDDTTLQAGTYSTTKDLFTTVPNDTTPQGGTAMSTEDVFTKVHDDTTSQEATYTPTKDVFTTVPDDTTSKAGTLTSTGDVFTTVHDDTTSETDQPMKPGTMTDNPDKYFYALIYGLAAAVMILFGVIKSFVFTKTLLRASTVLHNRVFEKVLYGPMRFFDTNPLGRIINRFSKDLDEADVQMAFTADNYFQQVLTIFGSLIIMCVAVPWFLVAALPIVIAFIVLNIWFKVGMRQLKRLDNISRSPVLGHLTSTLEGLATIHSFEREQQMLDRFTEIVDQHSVAFTLFYYSTRWFALRLDSLSASVTACICFTVVLVDYFGVLPAATGGLALLYGMELNGYFQWTMRMKSELEARFNSVERIQEYIEKITSEAPRHVADQKPAPEWPAKGCIQFDQYSMRYRQGLPLVLKNITCQIKSHEKVGIVGRTGSGKSSLGVALFRLVEPASGRILLDNVDISVIGLEDLRCKLSIIPQDPMLFIGTMRYNLDPFNLYGDDDIWCALEKAHIKDKVVALPLKLDAPVEENGRNFSVGERQLLCMSRAILRGSKVLLLDEATAAIDTETDAKIQITIREAFNECTLLTIAHRLNTVLDSDKILVMDDGELVEFGTPTELMANPTSKFNAMMKAVENSD